MAKAAGETKIVVIDDDPTGSQTVHGCPLLLRWDPDTLAVGLAHPSPLLFLLANTRALAPAEAATRVREICRALRPALAAAQATGRIDSWLVVSRGDSTLRGHFPLEVDVIAEELGPFDATLLVPAFLEGERTTVDGIHLLHGRPVHLSPFARDQLFAYTSSYLPAWVEEKSGGRIPAVAVQRIGLAELETGGSPLCRHLAALEGNVCVAVDSQRRAHLAALAAAVRELTAPGGSVIGPPRRFLFHCAASLIQALAALDPQPLPPKRLAALRRRAPMDAGPPTEPLPGLVLVGSHVPLADRQLARLLAEPRCGGVELEVARVLRSLRGPEPRAELAVLEQEWFGRLLQELAAGRTPVLFTSRGELACREAQERRSLGLALAAAMARIAAALAARLGYVISKGGITTHTLLAEGLRLPLVELQGQLLPGLSLVLTPAAAGPDGLDSQRKGPLPVLTFPGNLGEAETLRQAWGWMEGLEDGPHLDRPPSGDPAEG